MTGIAAKMLAAKRLTVGEWVKTSDGRKVWRVTVLPPAERK